MVRGTVFFCDSQLECQEERVYKLRKSTLTFFCDDTDRQTHYSSSCLRLAEWRPLCGRFYLSLDYLWVFEIHVYCFVFTKWVAHMHCYVRHASEHYELLKICLYTMFFV